MVRSTPPSDWVAYLVVLVSVAGILFGKYLIVKGDNKKENDNDKSNHNR